MSFSGRQAPFLPAAFLNFCPMKKLFLFLLTIIITLPLSAIPAMRTRKMVRQSNGTMLAINLRGDEHLHYYATDEGMPVVRQKDGNYYFARPTARGLVPTSTLATAKAPEQIASMMGEDCAGMRSLRRARMAERPSRAAVRKAASGSRRGLIILAEYTDVKFTFSHAQFDSIMNTPNYREGYFSGSAHDYFYEQSNGKFDLSFDVVGPVSLSKPMSYYGQNNNMGDVHVGEMVAEAIQLATSQLTDLSPYDWDDDGEIDQVVVIYAGYGEAMGAAAETVWPQEYTLTQSDYGRPVKVGNYKFNTYACTCELYGNETVFGSVKYITGTGPMCHEFSHCLGIPDTYDIYDQYHFTMCNWDLMDSGCYNNGTYCPAGYTGYEKWLCGWQEPIELSSPATITDMKGLSEGGDFYVVYNDQYNNRRDEYYILENRQWKGFDYWLPGKGLLITHVNYDEAAWRSNTINTEQGKERMAIIPANNLYTYKDSAQAGNPYPTAANNALTNTSTPAATVFNLTKKYTKTMDKPITDITLADDGTISFLFMGGNPDGISSVAEKDAPSTVCDVQGRELSHPVHGLNIVRQGNETKKIIVK